MELNLSIFSLDTLFSLSRRLYTILSSYFRITNHRPPFSSANIVIMSLPMSRVPIDPATCRTWFVFLFVSCAMLSAALDFVLMLRGESNSIMRECGMVFILNIKSMLSISVVLKLL